MFTCTLIRTSVLKSGVNARFFICHVKKHPLSAVYANLNILIYASKSAHKLIQCNAISNLNRKFTNQVYFF